MKLIINSAGRSFSAELQWAVVQSPADTLMAASFADLPTSTRAIYAALSEGFASRIVLDDSTIEYLDGSKGSYVKVEQGLGALTHMVVLHKAAVFQSEENEAPVVLAFDGNIRSAVSRYLAARHTLPGLWEDEYFSLLDPDHVEELQVFTSRHAPEWANLKAVRLSSLVTEAYVTGRIAERLKAGTLVIPPAESDLPCRAVFSPGITMKEYLSQNARALAEKLSVEVRPCHDPGQDPLDPAIAEMKRIPFPAQSHMIQGLANTLKERDSVFCCGDMGTGKTLVAIGVAYLLYREKGGGFRVLLAAPAITVPKWRAEIEASVEAKVTVLNSTEDALRYVEQAKKAEPEGLEFVIVSTDRAKLGPEPWAAAVWKRVRDKKNEYAWHCPDCGHVLVDPAVNTPDAPELGWGDMAEGPEPEVTRGPKTSGGLPVGYPVQWKRHPKAKKCPGCGAKLVRPALKAQGETKNRPRWYVCRILRRMRFDLLIQDEVHQVKAQDSGRGDSFAQLVKAADKTLSLTGTLVNGLATSIKETLWRTDPRELLEQGFDRKTGTVAWARRYGTLRRTYQVDEDDRGIVTRRKSTAMQVEELPGIAPQMTAHFLLHKTGFMELGDLGLPLVEIKEVPVFLPTDDEHGGEYRRFHSDLHAACRQESFSGGKGAWSRFVPATINYADRPDLGASIYLPNTNQVVTAEAFPADYFHAKERFLVDLVQKEVAEDRGVIIYANYTSSYGVDERLKAVLEAHGIQAEVLDAGVSPEKRIRWLADKETRKAKVLIANMKLVEVGLDLYPWPTIIFYQASYDINTVRQAGRRAWRIGQNRECRVYYLVYDGTQQVAQFEKIMAKRGHAMLVEGRLDKSELVRFARDAHSALAVDIAECLAASDLADRWTELVARDMDATLKLVSEAEFKKAVQEAQKALVAETLRLCGKQGTVTLVDTGREGGLAVARVKLTVVTKPKGRGKNAVVPGQLAWDFFGAAEAAVN